MSGLTDKQVQDKLNLLTKIANELSEEASRRYGPEGQLFYEAEGQFHFMRCDQMDAGGQRRQEGIVMTSCGNTLMGCGAW